MRKNILKEKNGQGTIEYVLVTALLIVVSIYALTILPNLMEDAFNKLETSVEIMASENSETNNVVVENTNNIINDTNKESIQSDNMQNIATLTPTPISYIKKEEKQTNKISFIREDEEIFCEYKKLEQRGNYYYIETNDRCYWLTPSEIKTIKVTGE